MITSQIPRSSTVGSVKQTFPKAKALRWVQQPSAGVEGTMYPAFKESDVILTNCQKLYGLTNF